MAELYQASGKVSPAGVAITCAAGIAAGAVLCVPYAYLIVYIPLIYANFLICAGFGLAIGYAVSTANHFGKVRSPVALAAAAGIAGLFATYFAWGADILARSSHTGISDGFTLNPSVIFTYMNDCLQSGTWGFGDVAVRGVVLGGIWLAEAIIIVGGAALPAWKSGGDTPFCEKCNEWTDVVEGARRLEFFEKLSIEMLRSGSVRGIVEAREAMPQAGSLLQVDVAKCPRCASSSYARILEVHHTQDEEGRPQTDATPAVDWVHIPADDAAALAGGAMPAIAVPVPVAVPAASRQTTSVRKPYAPPPWEEGPHNPGGRA